MDRPPSVLLRVPTSLFCSVSCVKCVVMTSITVCCLCNNLKQRENQQLLYNHVHTSTKSVTESSTTHLLLTQLPVSPGTTHTHTQSTESNQVQGKSPNSFTFPHFEFVSRLQRGVNQTHGVSNRTLTSVWSLRPPYAPLHCVNLLLVLDLIWCWGRGASKRGVFKWSQQSRESWPIRARGRQSLGEPEANRNRGEEKSNAPAALIGYITFPVHSIPFNRSQMKKKGQEKKK